MFREMSASEIPIVPVRSHLRPCCAFGGRLRVTLGPIPIPGYCIGNVTGPDEIGHHIYDSGVFDQGSKEDPDDGLSSNEENGLVYTCRGGFIDTAHVRDYADWTIFLATNIARSLETGLELDLPDEAGKRHVSVLPFPRDVIERIGRRSIAIRIGQWLAFQLSVWHEAATWFGWSSVAAFPEKVSAFSPEDLYSNIIGTRIAVAIASQRTARDELIYNRSADHWFSRILTHLGAVSGELGEQAMDAVDGLWWDSKKRLPDPTLVLKRNLAVGSTLTPWLVPPERMPPDLIAACGKTPDPLPITSPDNIDGRPFSEIAAISIEVSTKLARLEPFLRLNGKVGNKDFPLIIEVTGAQIRDAYGPRADQRTDQ